jgi:hypothetical protein
MGRHASGDASLDNGQEEGHVSGDACYGPCLVMGTSWSRDPLGFQHDAHFDGAGSMSTMTDPPSSESPYFDAHFDGAESMSTMTDPPPSESPLEKHCMSFSFAANSGSWNTNNDNQDTNNDNESIT